MQFEVKVEKHTCLNTVNDIGEKCRNILPYCHIGNDLRCNIKII
jgi:hypothetical protein